MKRDRILTVEWRSCWILACWLVLALALGGLDASASAQSPAEKAQAEWDRLHEMQQTMAAPEYIGRNATADLAAISNLKQYREHFKNLRTEFAAGIKSDEQPFRNLGYKLEHLERQLADFERAAKEYGSPAAIQNDCDQMLRMAKQAVQYQAPAYFRPENDIARSQAQAKVRLDYLRALSGDSPELKNSQKLWVDAQAEVAKIREALAASILEQNEVPQDQYQGGDRDQLIKLVNEAWTKAGGKGKVLKVGFVQPDWQRSVTWEIQNRTLYKNDTSRIQAFLIVAYDKQVAVRHSYNFVKDHLSNDQISGSFLEDPQQKPELMNQILLQKVK